MSLAFSFLSNLLLHLYCSRASSVRRQVISCTVGAVTGSGCTLSSFVGSGALPASHVSCLAGVLGMAESLAPVTLQDSGLLLVLLRSVGVSTDEETAVLGCCLHLFFFLERDLHFQDATSWWSVDEAHHLHLQSLLLHDGCLYVFFFGLGVDVLHNYAEGVFDLSLGWLLWWPENRRSSY